MADGTQVHSACSEVSNFYPVWRCRYDGNKEKGGAPKAVDYFILLGRRGDSFSDGKLKQAAVYELEFPNPSCERIYRAEDDTPLDGACTSADVMKDQQCCVPIACTCGDWVWNALDYANIPNAPEPKGGIWARRESERVYAFGCKHMKQAHRIIRKMCGLPTDDPSDPGSNSKGSSPRRRLFHQLHQDQLEGDNDTQPVECCYKWQPLWPQPLVKRSLLPSERTRTTKRVRLVAPAPEIDFGYFFSMNREGLHQAVKWCNARPMSVFYCKANGPHLAGEVSKLHEQSKPRRFIQALEVLKVPQGLQGIALLFSKEGKELTLKDAKEVNGISPKVVGEAEFLKNLKQVQTNEDHAWRVLKQLIDRVQVAFKL